MNITYGYKSSFNDLNQNFKQKDNNSATQNATNLLYMQKDEFEKILENEINQINKNKYPLLFERLKQKNENFVDIIINNNDIKTKENNFHISQKSDIFDNTTAKKLFKFFEGHEKKTEIEIENMNKNQLIYYSKQFLNRASQIEEYLDKYIQYKQGYKFNQEEEAKIVVYSTKLEKANEILKDITEKCNKTKLYIQKNNELINKLKKENVSLKKALNNILLMEQLTNPKKIVQKKNNSLNKTKYKDNMFDFYSYMTYDKNFDKIPINYDKNFGQTFTNFISGQNLIKNPIRCSTYNNSQKNIKINFKNNPKNRPFSSFHHIKTFSKK